MVTQVHRQHPEVGGQCFDLSAPVFQGAEQAVDDQQGLALARFLVVQCQHR